MVEYAKKFEDMVGYSNQDVYAPNKKWKINQLMFGLRGEIEYSVAQHQFDTYVVLL